MALTEPSKRLEAIPPYMFAELERRVAEKRVVPVGLLTKGGVRAPPPLGHETIAAHSHRRCSGGSTTSGPS